MWGGEDGPDDGRVHLPLAGGDPRRDLRMAREWRDGYFLCISFGVAAVEMVTSTDERTSEGIYSHQIYHLSIRFDPRPPIV